MRNNLRTGTLKEKMKLITEKCHHCSQIFKREKFTALWDGLILLQCGPRSSKGADGHSADRAGPQRQWLQRFRGELSFSPQGIKKQF